MKKIKTMKSLVKYLIENNKKISAMESCTGGEIAVLLPILKELVMSLNFPL